MPPPLKCRHCLEIYLEIYWVSQKWNNAGEYHALQNNIVDLTSCFKTCNWNWVSRFALCVLCTNINRRENATHLLNYTTSVKISLSTKKQFLEVSIHRLLVNIKQHVDVGTVSTYRTNQRLFSNANYESSIEDNRLFLSNAYWYLHKLVSMVC